MRSITLLALALAVPATASAGYCSTQNNTCYWNANNALNQCIVRAWDDYQDCVDTGILYECETDAVGGGASCEEEVEERCAWIRDMDLDRCNDDYDNATEICDNQYWECVGHQVRPR